MARSSATTRSRPPPMLPRDLPPSLTRKLPRYPLIPATLIGRLAVDRRYRGQGHGRRLLADALRRALASEVASFAVIVEARDDDARRFYERESFLSCPTTRCGCFGVWRTSRRCLNGAARKLYAQLSLRRRARPTIRPHPIALALIACALAAKASAASLPDSYRGLRRHQRQIGRDPASRTGPPTSPSPAREARFPSPTAATRGELRPDPLRRPVALRRPRAPVPGVDPPPLPARRPPRPRIPHHQPAHRPVLAPARFRTRLRRGVTGRSGGGGIGAKRAVDARTSRPRQQVACSTPPTP